MVHEKIKERKRLFQEEEEEKPVKTKGEANKKGERRARGIEMPKDRLVKACPGVKNPKLIFKDGKFMRA